LTEILLMLKKRADVEHNINCLSYLQRDLSSFINPKISYASYVPKRTINYRFHLSLVDKKMY